MKKILLITAIGTLFSLGSCKKTWTCECTGTSNGVSSTLSATITDTKKNATEACTSGAAIPGTGSSASCTIK